MKRAFTALIFVALLGAPWIGVWYSKHNSGMTQSCLIPYTLSSQRSGDNVHFNATISVNYSSTGSAIGVLHGSMAFTPQAAEKTEYYNVSRNSHFSYSLHNGYIIAMTKTIHAGYGEDAPAELISRYMFPSFKDNSRDYYQMLKMSNGDILYSNGNMARLYCHSKTH